MPELKSNRCYIITIFLATVWNSLITGFTLNGLNTTGATLMEQFPLSDPQLQIIVDSQVIGLGIGSYFVSYLLPMGRRNTLLFLNLFAALAVT